MKCAAVKINLPEYIDGKLDKNTHVIVRNHIDKCESCKEIYTELNSFLKFTDSFQNIEPPAGMKDEFLQLAELENNQAKKRTLDLPYWVKVAAMIIVVFGTFAAGYFTGSEKDGNNLLLAEMENLKQQVLLAGLRDYSGPQKIEAVYNVSSIGKTNDELINALVYTMNSDKNVNVRLAALHVLSGMMSKNETVKTELINSLSVQENPLIQISLIQVLTESGVKEARDKIESISTNEKTDQNVKEFAKDMVKTII